MYSTLFHIFGIPIRAYGLMMVIGFGLGLWRAVRVARHRGIDPDRVYDLCLIVLLAGIIGARLLYIAIDPETPLRNFFAVWDGGLSFHGGSCWLSRPRMFTPSGPGCLSGGWPI